MQVDFFISYQPIEMVVGSKILHINVELQENPSGESVYEVLKSISTAVTRGDEFVNMGQELPHIWGYMDDPDFDPGQEFNQLMMTAQLLRSYYRVYGGSDVREAYTELEYLATLSAYKGHKKRQQQQKAIA